MYLSLVGGFSDYPLISHIFHLFIIFLVIHLILKNMEMNFPMNFLQEPKFLQETNILLVSKCPFSLFSQIFDIEDLPSMQSMLRSNKWQTDPLSLGNACFAISARCDLNPPNLRYKAWGGIDCKITDNNMAVAMASTAVNGPTWDNQPVFAWNNGKFQRIF